MLLKEGELFHGRYRIISQLGSGGVGTIYSARQIDSNREVALKLLQPTSTLSERDCERFLREFRILAQLSHEHIITFYSAAISPEGLPYAVSEIIRGSDLHSIIKRQRRLPFARVLKIAEQICFAMEYAHSQGIIHRDLKPENIMLLDQPEPDWVKVLDFGFARYDSITETESGKEKLTATGMAVGTVCYMSPEQCKGGEAKIQSDIYALACIIYECITGNLLFEADSPMAVIGKQIYENPAPALKKLKTLVPPGFIPILQKALSKDPAKRHQTMQELRADLQSLPLEHKPASPVSKRKARSTILASFALILVLAIAAIAIIGSYSRKVEQANTATLSNARMSRLLSAQSADTLLNEADRLIEKHECPEAEIRLQLALDLAQHGRDHDSIFRADVLLTKAAIQSGDIEKAGLRAAETATTAKKYYSKKSNEYLSARKALAESCRSREAQRAKEILLDLINIWTKANTQANVEFVEILYDYISLLQAEGSYKLADQELIKCKRLFDSSEVPAFVFIQFICLQSGIKYELGEKDTAEKLAKQGIGLIDSRTELPLEQKVALIAKWSDMFSRIGNKEKALQLIRNAESRLKTTSSEHWLAELYTNEADMLIAAEKPEKALATLDQGYTVVSQKKEGKLFDSLSEICRLKAVCYMKLSQFNNSLHCIDQAIMLCPADATALLLKCKELRKQIKLLESKNVN